VDGDGPSPTDSDLLTLALFAVAHPDLALGIGQSMVVRHHDATPLCDTSVAIPDF